MSEEVLMSNIICPVLTRREFTRHFARVLTLGATSASLVAARTLASETPMSRLFTFTEGSNQVRVQCYLHTSQYRQQGWYEKSERVLKLSKPFRMA